jgi:hypothetical protein
MKRTALIVTGLLLGIFIGTSSALIPGPPVSTVPTMTQWGMIIMSILLLVSALYFMRKRTA